MPLNETRPVDGEQFLRTVPRQARSVARFHAILDAVGVILERGGVDALSMTEVAAEADIALASVYDYFADTRSMVGALMARAMRTSFDGVSQVLAEGNLADPAEITSTMTRALEYYVEHSRATPGLGQADAFCDADAELHAFRIDNSRQYAAVLAEAILPHTPEHLHDKVGPRALLATALVASATRLILAVEPDEAATLIASYVEIFIDALPER